ncbi:hypothetical protein A6V39_04815 [Candidatus Mycoplasma haematobovis]|uniref:Uncharacterized protein n=1 Tax=Candidatus Mycoplasma haematobovis TaxID=432608 RepID=A0A1A9QCA4_9MOLU|nr:hypothetical protein [Candidatus Mycoplasma haematobovis]OAL09868.1 hypothetical protein A6V39_04815 [Candidatus Mycoplasma haematobovis]
MFSIVLLSSSEEWKWVGIVFVFILSFVFAISSGYIRGKGIATLARNPRSEDLVFKKYMIISTICDYSVFFSPILGIFLALLAAGV